MSAGETDEPVTCDIKRLIRLPGSLHGKTGFRVKKIKIDDLVDFDPFEDTVVLSDELVKIYLRQDYKITMKNVDYDLKAGKNKVPVFLAVFLIGRRMANII